MLKTLVILLVIGFAWGERRISGGEQAIMGQFPYHVLIQKNWGGTDLNMCGGAVIRYNYVVTSAFCLANWIYIQVFLGLINKVQGPITNFAHVEDPDHVIIHPDFDPANDLSANIGLIYIQIANPGWLTQALNVVRLPSENDVDNDFEGYTTLATGFGMTSDDPTLGTSIWLKYVNMTVISNQVCQFTFGDFITDAKMCTDTSGGRSTCAGDEGGPLVTTIDGNFVLVGIGSFRSGAGCTVGHPAIFTRVTKFLDWIYEIVPPELEEPPQETTTLQPPAGGPCNCECHCYTCPALPDKKTEL